MGENYASDNKYEFCKFSEEQTNCKNDLQHGVVFFLQLLSSKGSRLYATERTRFLKVYKYLTARFNFEVSICLQTFMKLSTPT